MIRQATSTYSVLHGYLKQIMCAMLVILAVLSYNTGLLQFFLVFGKPMEIRFHFLFVSLTVGFAEKKIKFSPRNDIVIYVYIKLGMRPSPRHSLNEPKITTRRVQFNPLDARIIAH